MSRRLQKVFLTVTIPTVSLCATFILLYLFMPHDGGPNVEPTPKKVAETVHITHENTLRPPVVQTPIQLKIDKLAVAAAVNSKGLAANGDMDIDEDPEQVAWYNLGPKPGEEGSAVIAGHYGWKDGVPSVFNGLNKLVKGDKITTYGVDGSTKTFVVTRTALYAPDQDATDVFRSDDGKAHLNLITCQGTWVKSARSYSERLIVFTDLVQ